MQSVISAFKEMFWDLSWSKEKIIALSIAGAILFILIKIKNRMLRNKLRRDRSKFCMDVSERQADWRRG